jgi:hypothetical protein
MAALESKTMFQEGQSVLYCLGDKEEQVTIIKIHPDSITILIPSTNKERDTLPERLKPIIEKVREPVFELPVKEPSYFGSSDITLKEVALKTPNPLVVPKDIQFNQILINDKWKRLSIESIVSRPYNEDEWNLNTLFHPNNAGTPSSAYVSELYKEVVNLETRDNVLLENQKLMFEQIKKQQKEIDELKLMLKSQKEIHELELKELRKLIKSEPANMPVVPGVDIDLKIQEVTNEIREMKRRGASHEEFIIKYDILTFLKNEYRYKTGKDYVYKPTPPTGYVP